MDIARYTKTIKLPGKDSHKGENGRLLIIGGSELFHAASAWSLEAASRIVDLVLYSSIPENNELVKEAKKNFWDGIVVPRKEVEQYISEADCILIGPGMTRDETHARLSPKEFRELDAHTIDWDHDAYAVSNYLFAKYPEKKWVVDAGALQMIEPELCTPTMVLTPHPGEFERVFGEPASEEAVVRNASKHHNATILLKGVRDIVSNGERTEVISGGNEGMTKGGTGDVLAGLVAALYCMNDAFSSAVVGSYINKTAGDELYRSVGPFFNATDLVHKLPKVLNAVLRG